MKAEPPPESSLVTLAAASCFCSSQPRPATKVRVARQQQDVQPHGRGGDRQIGSWNRRTARSSVRPHPAGERGHVTIRRNDRLRARAIRSPPAYSTNVLPF